MNKVIVKYIHILFSSISFTFIFFHSANGCDTIKISTFLDNVFIHVDSLSKKQNTDSVIHILSFSLESIENEKCLHHFRVNELYQKLGYAHQLKSNFEKAEHNYFKSIEILKQYVGEHDMALARSYNLLGNLYVDMGLYNKSDSVYHVVKSMYSTSLGKDHLWMGWIYHNIGRLRIYQGKLRESLLDLMEALRIKIVNVGQDDIDTAGTMVYLGYVYAQLGDVRTAEYYSTKSSEIWINYYGNGSEYHAYAAHNLINIHLSLGNYKKAEELANTAIELKIKYLGSYHASLATSYNAMGNIFQVQQKYQTAIENYRKAKQIFLFLKDTTSVEFVFVNHNLGVCYLGIKNFELAGFYLKKALHLKYFANGDENMDYVSTLIHTAEWMVLQNNFAEAEKYMLSAKKYMETNRIDINDNYLLLLSLFEKKALYDQDKSAALTYLEKELFTIQQQLDHLSLIGAEHEMLKFIDKSEIYVNRYLGFCLNNIQDVDFEVTLLENVLFFKHYLLTDYQFRRNFAQADVENRDDYLKYFQVNQEILQVQLEPYKNVSGNDSLLWEKAKIERAILHRMEKRISNENKISWQDLQKTIKEGEAIVEFVSYNEKFGNEDPPKNVYAAIIMKYGDLKPKVIPLPNMSSLDSFLSVQDQIDADLIFELYSSEPIKDIHGGAGYNLYQIIFYPLHYFLEDIKTIYYSSTGMLYQINVNAIVVDDTTFLSDKYELIQLGSTKQVLFKEDRPGIFPSHGYVAGGVNYDSEMIEAANHNPAKAKNHDNKGNQGIPKPELQNSIQYWKNIPYSDEEVETIKNIFIKAGLTTDLKRGRFATESSIKSIGNINTKSPEVIHISTHGYFFSKPDNQINSLVEKSEFKESVFQKNNHPLIRSGLIMAGGNISWYTQNKDSARIDDGILTAYEISQLNLSNTELVVLSACVSGLGYVYGHEGIFGLQRAFKIAGVKNLIVSLWSIPDFQTKELMVLFYENWLIKKMTIRNSLKLAQETMRNQGYEPYYWAGFVLVE